MGDIKLGCKCSCNQNKFICSFSLANTRPHCKLPDQIDGATWPNGLVEQLKSLGVEDKPSGFITSNEADRLCHLVQLNGGKCQRKADQPRSLRFFFNAIFIIHSPPSTVTIAGPSNSRYCVFVNHF